MPAEAPGGESRPSGRPDRRDGPGHHDASGPRRHAASGPRGAPHRPSRVGGLRRLAGTVRFRVTALAALAVLAVLTVTGVALVGAQRRILTDGLDERLQQRADDLAADVADGPLPSPLRGASDDDDVAQVVDGDGRVAAASATLAGRGPVAAPPPAGRGERLSTVDLPVDDSPFRLLVRRVETADGPVTVIVGGATDDIDESTAALTLSALVAVPVVTAVLAALIWWLVGRTLRPVEAIRTEVAAIGGTDLHRRVPDPGGDDEVARLARTMNAMLARVEEATQRQQRFVADASHELRSPLTRIRSEIEVDQAHPGTADLGATHRSVLAETVGMQHLVDDLLHLARSDAAIPLSRPGPVDLDDIVLEQAWRTRGDGRVTVDAGKVTPLQVHGNVEQLARAVANLADNAARHARRAVTLRLYENGGRAVLTVADDGPGIPPDQREHIFDRFARLDEARDANRGGTGLGLAIARDLIERHGGTIAVDPDHEPGARFVITLPLLDGRSDDPAGNPAGGSADGPGDAPP